MADRETIDTTIKAAVAYLRYRMSFFVDTYFTKVNPLMFKLVGADHGGAQEKIVDEILRLLQQEIEPLLVGVHADGVGPYFGGSEKLTVAEVCASLHHTPNPPCHNQLTLILSQAMTAPFVLRLVDFCNDIIFPSRLATAMLDTNSLPNFAKWAELCMQHPSVMATWDKEYMVPRIVERLPAAKKKYAPKAE